MMNGLEAIKAMKAGKKVRRVDAWYPEAYIYFENGRLANWRAVSEAALLSLWGELMREDTVWEIFEDKRRVCLTQAMVGKQLVKLRNGSITMITGFDADKGADYPYKSGLDTHKINGKASRDEEDDQDIVELIN